MSDLQDFYERGLTVEGREAAKFYKDKQAKIGASDGPDLSAPPTSFVTQAQASGANGLAAWAAMTRAQQQAWITAHPSPSASTAITWPTVSTGSKVFWGAVGIGTMSALAYHGYKRSGIGGALLWGLLGELVWPITLPVAFAQGFGKPKKK